MNYVIITSSVAEGGTLPRNTHGILAAAESMDATANGLSFQKKFYAKFLCVAEIF